MSQQRALVVREEKVRCWLAGRSPPADASFDDKATRGWIPRSTVTKSLSIQPARPTLPCSSGSFSCSLAVVALDGADAVVGSNVRMVRVINARFSSRPFRLRRACRTVVACNVLRGQKRGYQRPDRHVQFELVTVIEVAR